MNAKSHPNRPEYNKMQSHLRLLIVTQLYQVSKSVIIMYLKYSSAQFIKLDQTKGISGYFIFSL